MGSDRLATGGLGGNARRARAQGCEQWRRCREARVPSGIISSEGESETAKFLPVCKAVPPTTFALAVKPADLKSANAKVVGGEPQEVIGDDHPRYMTIANFTYRR